MYLTPAHYIVHVFGGVRKAAREINRAPSGISRWISRDNGRIPSEAMSNIMEAARRLKLDVTSDDLLKGRKIDPRKLKLSKLQKNFPAKI